jgi:hypothetical protein
MLDSGVGFADFPRGRRPDRKVACAGESHGSLAGTRNPWVPLLAPEEGVLVVRSRRGGNRLPALQNRNTLSIETGARGSNPAYNYMDVI